MTVQLRFSERVALAVLAMASATVGLVIVLLPGTPGHAAEAPPRVDAYGDPLPEGAVARFGTRRWFHPSGVLFLAYSADGKEVITADHQGVVRVWEAATGKELQQFSKRNIAGPAVSVNTLDLSPDRKTLAVASGERTFTLWDVTTGKEIRTFRSETSGTTAYLLQFTPDGQGLIGYCEDGLLRLFDSDGKDRRSFGDKPRVGQRTRFVPLGTAGTLALTPDGKNLMMIVNEVVNTEQRSLVRTWDVESGKETAAAETLPVPNGGFPFTFAPDGKTVVGGSLNTLFCWDRATGKELQKMVGPTNNLPVALLFSPDGKRLAVRHRDQTVHVWEVAAGKEVHQFGAPVPLIGPAFLVQGTTRAHNLAFSPDSQRLAFSTPTNRVRQFDVTTGKEVE